MSSALPRYIGVVGSGAPDAADDPDAQLVGRRIAEAGATLVCGGLGGVMEAACRGARGAGGTTVGLLPGSERDTANPYVDVAIPTGLGEARNLLVARAADVLIAIRGGYGTLSEIAFALRIGRVVVALDTWQLSPPDGSSAGLITMNNPEAAVREALARLL